MSTQPASDSDHSANIGIRPLQHLPYSADNTTPDPYTYDAIPIANNEAEVVQDAAPPRAEGDAQEAIQRAGVAAPYNPTKAEIEQHNVTHLPYRSWCPVCVKAKGKATGHRVRESHHHAGVPITSMDYCFLCESGDVLDTEGDGEEAPMCKVSGHRLQPIVVMYDARTKGIYAHSVAKKGANPGACKLISR